MNVEKKPSIAIIVRRNRDVERVLSLLEQNGIPALAERGADIFSHSVGVLYFSLLEFLADSSKIESLAKTLSFGMWDFGFEKSALLIRKIRSGDSAELFSEIPKLKDLKKQITTSGAIEYLVLAGEISGLAQIALRDPLSAEVWRSIISLARDIALRGKIENPAKLIEELLSYRASAETKSIKISSGPQDAQIHVMTAHGSKGLEYDYVFLPYANEEAWMSKKRSSSFVLPREKGDADEVHDSRRLFYVALTRARKHAVISYGLVEGLNRSLTPLRFIGELDPSHVFQKNIDAVYDLPQSKTLEQVLLAKKKELIEYSKNVLLEKGLSVTALNHFMNCPSEFFYKSILKVPEAPAANGEKGNAMHEAISEVWKLKIKTEETITKTLLENIHTYFTGSLLPVFEKETIVEELMKNGPKVARALLSHFSLPGRASPEIWVDTFYDTKVRDESIQIRLHGKLDMLLEGDEKTCVFDYKTKEGMSENEIKGLTKNSDGGYFRQLIYYKLLLQDKSKYKEIEPALVFVKPDEKGRCPIVSLSVQNADIERVKGEVQKLIESVWAGNIFSEFCEKEDCEWCRLKRLVL